MIVAGVLTNSLTASVSMGHPSGSFVTRKTKAWHVAQKLADLIASTYFTTHERAEVRWEALG